MPDHVLTLNAGSSSLKFGVFSLKQTAIGEPRQPIPIATGQVDAIGVRPHLKMRGSHGEALRDRALEMASAQDAGMAVQRVLDTLKETHPKIEVRAVGHRVVHGGTVYEKPTELSDAVIEELETYAPFAPQHQPFNLAGVRAAQDAFPDARQIACFDTAFHRRHPWVNDVFAIPLDYYHKGVRRYGFHGLSYDYISHELERIAPHLHAGRVIVAHLGNGASMCGMIGGRSIGSSMGFSAVDGLPMGTRCGQLDPGVMLYLMENEGLSAKEISDMLFKRSGLLGLSGISNDMRTLEASDAPEAQQAIDYFVFRARREIGALAAVLGGLDAVVFCGGIGENAANIRARICEGMAWIGMEIDRASNQDNRLVVSTELSRVRVMVIRTNEELVIARAASQLLAQSAGGGPA